MTKSAGRIFVASLYNNQNARGFKPAVVAFNKGVAGHTLIKDRLETMK
jgi:hypothetical protein